MNQNAKPKILATDLDGTLIPLKNHPNNGHDLQRLKELIKRNDIELVFVTGRHLKSVTEAIQTYDLPKTNWIICDVGTSLYSHDGDGQYQLVDQYSNHLDKIVRSMGQANLRRKLEGHDELRIQESAKLGKFKLSYYADQSQLATLLPTLKKQLEHWKAPWSLIGSVDPFNGDGLIDFLPKGVSKAYALSWWANFTNNDAETIVFAGDSGNDIAALTAGYRSIVVGNAADEVVTATQQAHDNAGWTDRLFVATLHATSGVLEGCRQYWESY